jgi:intracellular sulfur oxidation DsrE/DsrF family protein
MQRLHLWIERRDSGPDHRQLLPFNVHVDQVHLAKALEEACKRHTVVVRYRFRSARARRIENDQAYNNGRHVKPGNPYAELMAALMKQGVQIELCGATAQANHWGNADLLPGVKININAMVRITQLEQQGYTLIYE